MIGYEIRAAGHKEAYRDYPLGASNLRDALENACQQSARSHRAWIVSMFGMPGGPDLIARFDDGEIDRASLVPQLAHLTMPNIDAGDRWTGFRPAAIMPDAEITASELAAAGACCAAHLAQDRGDRFAGPDHAADAALDERAFIAELDDAARAGAPGSRHP